MARSRRSREVWKNGGATLASEAFEYGDQFARCVPHREALSRPEGCLEVTGVAQAQRPARIWTPAAVCRGRTVGHAAWHRPCNRERWRHAPIMKLLPLDTPERIELVAGWLGKPDNYKWLDFGNGVQRVTPITLKIMSQRDLHVFRIYTAGDEDAPAGVVGLTNVDRNFKTASLWAVLGSKRYGGR